MSIDTKENPRVTALLDEAEALVKIKAATVKEIAAHVGKPFQRASEWLRRVNAPNGETYAILLEWVAAKRKTLRGLQRANFAIALADIKKART